MKCCFNCSFSEGCQEQEMVYCRKRKELVYIEARCDNFRMEYWNADPFE